MADIRETLKERGKQYGDYFTQTMISQRLKRVMKNHAKNLEDDQEDALEMIAVKIARILNGNPNHIDNWDDIAGYATLVADRLRKET